MYEIESSFEDNVLSVEPEEAACFLTLGLSNPLLDTHKVSVCTDQEQA